MFYVLFVLGTWVSGLVIVLVVVSVFLFLLLFLLVNNESSIVRVWVALIRAVLSCGGWGWDRTSGLSAESVQSAALPFQGVDHIHSGDSLPLGVLGVGDSITDDVLKENFEDATGLFVDQTRDTLDTATASQTTDGGLGDTLDVIAQDFAVTFGAPFTQTFSSFAASRHDAMLTVRELQRMLSEKNVPKVYVDEKAKMSGVVLVGVLVRCPWF